MSVFHGFVFFFQHGMTPLMNAAYKGKAEMCELLLAQGADVNSNYHEHQVRQPFLLRL